MFTLLLLCISWCLILADDPDATRIVGGVDAKIKDFPYQVSIMLGRNHNCGGSILSESTILTAAHCVVGKNPSTLSIRAGSDNSDGGGTVVKVQSYRFHKLYKNLVDYDIALIYLSDKLVFSPEIQPIKLSEEPLCGDADVTTTGWGYLREGGPVSKVLQSVEFKIVPPKTCSDVYDPGLGTVMFCAGSMAGGKDSCQGDSGGPLTLKGEQIGITAHGRGCGRPGIPGVFTNVPILRDWIIAYLM